MKMVVGRLSQVFVILMGMIATGERAMAQAPGTVANEESSYLVWVVFGGAALVICATGFMNPKRSHLN